MPKNINIPKGKVVKLRNAKGVPVVRHGIPLVIDGDVTISASSSFSPLMGSGSGGILGKLQQIGDVGRLMGFGFSAQFKQFGAQLWTGTDPFSINLTFTFYMGIIDEFDAKKEVYDPVMDLQSLTLPTEGEGGNLISPGPSSLEVLKETAETLQESQQSKQLNRIGTAFGVAVGRGQEEQSRKNMRQISLKIGNIIDIDYVVVKKAEPTWSSEVDENGYPIWATISMDIQSLFTATKEMLTGE